MVLIKAHPTNLLICYDGGTARVGIDAIVRRPHMLMQFGLGEESLATADAGMRLLAGMHPPLEGNYSRINNHNITIYAASLPHVGN